MSEIKDILLRIESRLSSIEDRLTLIEKATCKMDSHINFVDSVYEKVQSPFHSLMDMTSGYLGTRTIEEK